MGKKGEGSKQFRWTKPMERILLKILADEVNSRNRPNNSFKVSSFNKVASAIKGLFVVECSFNHVEHCLRTIKNVWSIVEQLRGKSDFGWDENIKMVVASPSVYEYSELGELVTAISRLTANQLDIDNLYEEAMKTGGFDEEFLATTFDYLVEHERLAKAFLAKKDRLRKIWLKFFQKQHNT